MFPLRLTLSIILVTLFAALPVLAVPPPTITRQMAIDPLNVYLYFDSTAVAAARNGEAKERHIEVRLPKSYATDSQRRYPVLYTLHGFGDAVGQFIPLLRGAMDTPKDPLEIIVVAIDGENKLGGSFYANSALTGNFADLVVTEVVPLIDATYRTLPNREGRALAGFSMGGFGAWSLALAHPDLFSAAWARCPGAFDPNGTHDAFTGWNETFRTAYGSAFSPQAPYPGNPLKFDGSPADNALIAAWDSGFGDIPGKLTRYRSIGQTLKELDFDYGTGDDFAWIPRGTAYIAEQLQAAGLIVNVKKNASGHVLTRDSINKGLVPFLKRVFSLP